MARHADFGVVVSINENLANEVLSSIAGNVSAQSFNVPAINLGGNIVNISGSLQLLPPTVVLHERPDNLVTVTLALQGTLTFSSSSMGTVAAGVILATSVDVPLAGIIVNNKVFAVLDLSGISITSAQLQASTNPPSPFFQNALASPGVLSKVTSIFRQLNLLATPPLMSSMLSQPISRGVSYGQSTLHNVSRFPPYPSRVTVSLSLGKIAIKPFEGALTVAADFDGVTNGDSNRLVNLLTEWSPLVAYVYAYAADQGSSEFSATEAGVDEQATLVLLMNPVVLSHILSTQVSPAFDRGPCIDDKTLVHEVCSSMGWLDAGDPYGSFYGLTIGADASVYASTTEDNWGYFWPATAAHVPASVTAYARMVAVVGKQGVPGWKVELVNTSVSTPFLFELVAAFEGLTLFLWLAAWIPALVVLYAGLALIIAAAIPGLLSWIDAVVLEAGSNALEGASIPASQTPFFLGATWTQDIRKLGFTQEGAEAHVRLYQNSLVSSLRTNLVLRGLNPAAGLRAISPPVSSVRKLMGS